MRFKAENRKSFAFVTGCASSVTVSHPRFSPAAAGGRENGDLPACKVHACFALCSIGGGRLTPFWHRE
jgi:hypothetical protein